MEQEEIERADFYNLILAGHLKQFRGDLGLNEGDDG